MRKHLLLLIVCVAITTFAFWIAKVVAFSNWDRPDLDRSVEWIGGFLAGIVAYLVILVVRLPFADEGRNLATFYALLVLAVGLYLLSLYFWTAAAGI